MRRILHVGQCMWHRPVESIGVHGSIRQWGLNDPFSSRDFQCFSMSRTTPKIVSSRRTSTTIHGSWSEVSHQTASRSVQPFLHSSPNTDTHRHTDHVTGDICSSRPHLCLSHEMRPNNCITGTARKLIKKTPSRVLNGVIYFHILLP